MPTKKRKLDYFAAMMQYMSRAHTHALSAEQRAELDPFGVIAQVADELLDHDLLVRAAGRDPAEISELTVAGKIVADVTSTCEHAPHMVRALQSLKAAIIAMQLALGDVRITDFTAPVQAAKAAAEEVRKILEAHEPPAASP